MLLLSVVITVRESTCTLAPTRVRTRGHASGSAPALPYRASRAPHNVLKVVKRAFSSQVPPATAEEYGTALHEREEKRGNNVPFHVESRLGKATKSPYVSLFLSFSLLFGCSRISRDVRQVARRARALPALPVLSRSLISRAIFLREGGRVPPARSNTVR